MKKIVIGIASLLFSLVAFSQNSIVGKYKQIDDDSGDIESIIEIRLENGKLYGKIQKIFPKQGEDPNPICTKCEGIQKNKPIVGMDIILGINEDDGVWEKDDGILDPKTGTLYDVKIWLEGEELKVRGYIGFIYRTQTWLKIES